MPSLSVVVAVDAAPADFKAFLNRLLQSVAPLSGSEIIVVDATSGSDISKICRAYGVSVLRGNGPRYGLLKKAAVGAVGDYLLFLDANTSLPPEFADVWRMIRRQGHVWGFFALRFRQSSRSLRWLARLISMRTGLSGVAMAEQGLFMQRHIWKALDKEGVEGYVELCRRLQTLESPCRMREAIESDAQHWQQLNWKQWLCAGFSTHYKVEGVTAAGAEKPDARDSERKKRAPELP